MLYLPVGVLQGIASLSLPFTAILSTIIFGERLGRKRWLSLALCGIGSVLFSTSGILGSSKSRTAAPMHLQMLAYCLAILAALVNAMNTVAKAKLMKDTKVDPSQLVGFMGFWMMLLLPSLGFPVLVDLRHGGPAWWGADFRNISMQLHNNSMIWWLLVALTMSTAATAVCGNMVIVTMSGTWMKILSGPARIAALWLTDLITYYAGCPACAWASPWTSFGWLQAVGFLLIAAGTFTYSQKPQSPDAQVSKKQLDSNASGKLTREDTHLYAKSKSGTE